MADAARAALSTETPADPHDGSPAGPSRLPPALGALRVLADGRTAALVRRDGEVVWWCLPTLDGEPVLWSLLDPDGPRARWPGLRAVEAEQVPAAPALRTVLRCRTGRVECLDGLLWDDDGADGNGTAYLTRLVRGLDDELDVEHELDPGRGGWDGAPPDAALAARADREPLVPSDGGTVRTRLRAPRGTWRAVLVGRGALPGHEADALHRRLTAARETADDAVEAASLPRPHPERVRDALRVLHGCAVPGSGAVAASLTTSLPEAMPGDRQWDYRYCWLRDASLGVSVASLVGAHDTADRFLDLVVRVLGDDPLSAAPVFALDGGPVPDESPVEGVAGWAGATPVRTGNGARDQVQHDALGLFVEAVSVHVQTGGGLRDDTWRAVRRVADGVAELVLSDRTEPSSGIWELREPRHLVSEDVGRWLALDRAVWIARGWRPLGHRADRRRWKRAAEVLEQRVLGALRPDGTLPLDYDEPDGPTDASALFVALFGMRRGERAQRLVLATLDRLGAGPTVYRYDPAPRDGVRSWDGLLGREGAFLPVSFMAVGALAAVGLLDQARERLDALCAQLPRLLPEMWDPVEARGLGNVPLLWSHMELVRAVYVLDALDRRRRLGPVLFAGWRVARYVSLRRQRSSSSPRAVPNTT